MAPVSYLHAHTHFTWIYPIPFKCAIFSLASVFSFRGTQVNKAQIKLKISQLYRADGFAVRELLKIADLLYRATTTEYQDEVRAHVCSSFVHSRSLPFSASAPAVSATYPHVSYGSHLYCPTIPICRHLSFDRSTRPSVRSSARAEQQWCRQRRRSVRARIGLKTRGVARGARALVRNCRLGHVWTRVEEGILREMVDRAISPTQTMRGQS